MQRDFLFLVRDIPSDLLIHDQHYFLATPSDQIMEKFRETARNLPDLSAFLERRSRNPLVCLGVRNDFDNESGAASSAWRTVSGIVDGYCLVAEDSAPEVCSILQIRTGNSPDVAIKAYVESAWALFHPENPASARRWEDRRSKFFRQSLRFFDVGTSGDPKAISASPHNPLMSGLGIVELILPK